MRYFESDSVVYWEHCNHWEAFSNSWNFSLPLETVPFVAVPCCEALKCRYQKDAATETSELVSVSLQSLGGRTCSKAHLQQGKGTDSFWWVLSYSFRSFLNKALNQAHGNELKWSELLQPFFELKENHHHAWFYCLHSRCIQMFLYPKCLPVLEQQSLQRHCSRHLHIDEGVTLPQSLSVQ